MQIILNKFVLLPKLPMTDHHTLPLHRLPKGTPARILTVGGSDADATLETLLLGLGFEEGAAIELRHQGAFGGPLAVRVDDRLVALRPADAAAIQVEVTPQHNTVAAGAVAGAGQAA